MELGKWKGLRTNKYLWLFLITSGLFGILFIRFILGEYAYFYVDMGGDTFDINYPLYRLFSGVFQGGGYEDYMLNAGLGMDMSSYVYQYLNPFNLLVVLMPQQLLPWAVLLATYLKLLTISIFGYKFFHKLINSELGSFTAALAWTFSSYIMLWGQHYGFCTSLVLFTVFMYLVHLYGAEKERSRNWILVLFITLMLFTNYYFLYMSGIFAALYLLIYLICQKASPKTIVKKLAGLGGMGILGICIGGVCLIPILNIFSGSTRAEAVNLNYFDSLIRPYSPRWRFAFLSRLFSNNLLGVADKYSGVSNYYELAMIFTSSLFFFGLPYVLTKKKLRVRTIVLTLSSVVLLLLPITGKLLTFNNSTQRWSFILCFMEAVVIGLMVKFLKEETSKRSAAISVAAGLGFTAVSFCLLFWGESQKYYKRLDRELLMVCGIFVLLYGLLILLKVCTRRLDRWFPVLLTVLVVAELAVSNYPAINNRKSPTRNQVAVEYYNDGSAQAAKAVKEADEEPFRIAKTYESASENDGMAQGYNGLSVYLTTNSKELIQLKDTYGGKGVSDNFVYFPTDNFIFNALLGTKYLFANTGDKVSPYNYAHMKTLGGKEVYESRMALPFGYLYHSKWEKEAVEAQEETDRILAAVNGFYFTNEESDTVYPAAQKNMAGGTSLMSRRLTANDCTVNQVKKGIRLEDMEEDPNIVWQDVEDTFGKGFIHTITIEADAPKGVDMALYYKSREDENFRADQIHIFDLSKKKSVQTFFVPGDVNDIRLDVSTRIPYVIIKDVRVNRCDQENNAYMKLQNTPIKDVKFADNQYSALVSNEEKQKGMLCIPLLYGRGFTARIDGEKAPLYNINNGLCGIEVPAGEHRVTLTYEIPHKRAGIALTLGGSMLYFLIFPISWFRSKRKGAIS